MITPDLVSIIIPAWKATWFETALQSALQQDYPACEIIIGDDSQTDDIASIVERLRPASRWPIAYERHTPSLGEMKNSAACLAKAQGKYIKFLHDDDVLQPNCVSQLVQAIQRHPAIVMATSHRAFIDVQGEPLPAHAGSAPLFNDNSVLYGPDVVAFQAEGPLNFIGEPSTVLIDAETLRATLAAGERLNTLAGEPMPFLADLAMYLKVLRVGHLAFVCQTLSHYRLSRSQTLSTAQHRQEKVADTHKKLPLMLKKLGWESTDRPKGHIRVAPLSSPEAFLEQNLYREIALSLRQSHYQLWLSRRQLLPAQLRLSQTFFADKGPGTLCTFYLDARNSSRQAWERTCQSLNITIPGLRWQVIALVDRQVDFLPATVEQLVLEGSGGLDALNSQCRAANSDWLLFLEAGCELLPSGLHALSFALTEASHCHAIYTDLIYSVQDKDAGLLFRPDFNLDGYLSAPGQMSRYWLFRREWVVASGGIHPAWPERVELELGLRLIESVGVHAIGHLHEPLAQRAKLTAPHPHEHALLLAHLRRRGYSHAEITPAPHGLWRLHYHHPDRPRVTLVVLAKDFSSVSRCVLALLENTGYTPVEWLIVADRRDDAERARWLDEISRLAPQQIRILHYAGSWHRAAMANQAILHARGDYLLFLHSDIEVTEPDWLDNMLNHAQRPEVAIVGGKQLYASNAVRHAGYVLGMRGTVAGEPFYGTDDGHSGYMNRLHADQNVSAVSGDFMLVKREICIAVNGFDADLSRYDDVDFCLRVAEQGGLIVWTPYARCCRHPGQTDSESAPAQHETDTLFARWLPLLSRDPAYNINFSLNADFVLPADAQARPLPWRPLPVVLPLITGQHRESDWRIAMPFHALRAAGHIEGKISQTLPTLPEIARYQPDTVIIELRESEDFARWMQQLVRFSPAFKIATICAPALAALPSSSAHALYDDVVRRLKRHLSGIDRLIVADEQMADLFADVQTEIVVTPTGLPEKLWAHQPGPRPPRQKPRIGLPAACCQGDTLSLMEALTEAFSDEVDWVVYGNCPPSLRLKVQKVQREIDTEVYHRELALLRLDLALIPHDGHPLTHSLACMHLLEYGATGIPAICSHSLKVDHSLVFTSVANQVSCWYDAIKMHLADPEGSEKRGLALQRAVKQRCLTREDTLAESLKTWMPGR